jgi:alpha-galactosidase
VPYFLKDDKLIERLRIPVREYIRRVELNERAFQAEKDYYLTGNRKMKGVGPRMIAEYFRAQEKPGYDQVPGQHGLAPSREYAIQIIHALETGQGRLVYGIGPNSGTVDNLPADCMIDGPNYVDGAGMHPLYIGELPPQLAALILPQINVQRLAVHAALSRQKKYVHFAALADPLASAVLSLDQIHELTNELLKAHKKHLPDFS